MATYQDPRYKALPFLSRNERSQVSEDVESQVMALAEAESVNKAPQSSEGDDGDQPLAKKQKMAPGPVSKLLGDIFSAVGPTKSPIEQARSKLVQYEVKEPL